MPHLHMLNQAEVYQNALAYFTMALVMAKIVLYQWLVMMTSMEAILQTKMLDISMPHLQMLYQDEVGQTTLADCNEAQVMAKICAVRLASDDDISESY